MIQTNLQNPTGTTNVQKDLQLQTQMQSDKHQIISDMKFHRGECGNKNVNTNIHLISEETDLIGHFYEAEVFHINFITQ